MFANEASGINNSGGSIAGNTNNLQIESTLRIYRKARGHSRDNRDPSNSSSNGGDGGGNNSVMGHHSP